jgi:hypothetical protein
MRTSEISGIFIRGCVQIIPRVGVLIHLAAASPIDAAVAIAAAVSSIANLYIVNPIHQALKV